MPLLIKSLPTLHFLMGFLIGCLTLAFLLRIILTWYPKIDLKTGLWPIVFLPTEPILVATRKIFAPIGRCRCNSNYMGRSLKSFSRIISWSTRFANSNYILIYGDIYNISCSTNFVCTSPFLNSFLFSNFK